MPQVLCEARTYVFVVTWTNEVVYRVKKAAEFSLKLDREAKLFTE